MVEKSRDPGPPPSARSTEGLDFDLDRALRSIVSLQTNIPEDAFTAPILGVRRAGSGVVIRDSGLVLTIGYLITEAESVWLTSASGRVVPAHALAIDPVSGFGLVQALGDLALPALELGRSSQARVGDAAIVAAGGDRQFVRAEIVARQEFSGYWEYYLPEVIFTRPAHPFWGGAGLIGRDGKLLGIGSLHVERVSDEGTEDTNMIVPIDLLPPVLDDLLAHGRPAAPPRPWLGVFCSEDRGKVVIGDVVEQGPAAAAGMRAGDVVSAVRDSAVALLRDFYLKVWSCGSAGVEIPMEIVRDGRSHWLRVKSADRASFLKKPRLH